jgi:serine/threonine protein phosphatase 1
MKPPSTEGRLVYAIGDVHGSLALLEALIATLAADALRSRPRLKPMLILLGDYIDRGEKSAQVLDLVHRVKLLDVFETRTLMGNHERAMLNFLEDTRAGPSWLAFGGAETLNSYGIAPPGPRVDAAGWEAVRGALAIAAEHHLEFLRALELMVVVGDYAFVHAGIRPGVKLDRQTEQDLLWIRDEFRASTLAHEKIIVHGHSPATQAQLAKNRLGIDTGAYTTGILTALRLEGESRQLIQVKTGSAAVAPAARSA